jgi:hypothetical protein
MSQMMLIGLIGGKCLAEFAVCCGVLRSVAERFLACRIDILFNPILFIPKRGEENILLYSSSFQCHTCQNKSCQVLEDDVQASFTALKEA